MKEKSMLALGLMSGTSLDGIDLALCRFHKKDTRWSFEIIAADTVSYDAEWTEKLRGAENSSAQEILLLHNEYGRYTAKIINRFTVWGFIGFLGLCLIPFIFAIFRMLKQFGVI